MGNIQVFHDPATAAQQLAVQRENINANSYLTQEAKGWHICYYEWAFADVQYGQTLAWPVRTAWAICTMPASLA